MSASLRHECIRVPVTALAFCDKLLLVAEGNFVNILHHENSALLATQQIFDSQAIHGITVCFETASETVVIFWGGSLLLLGHLKYTSSLPLLDVENLHEPRPQFQLSQVVEAPDWILDLSFCPTVNSVLGDQTRPRTAAVITAHNALLEVHIVYHGTTSQGAFMSKSDSIELSISELTASSRCILYSGHLLWLSNGRVLVAAGTAFGEILVWSWIRGQGSSSNAKLHHIFTGHEGSVFGVRISEEVTFSDRSSPGRLLASCSDDRSIRIWDISELPAASFSKSPQEGADALHVRETGFGANTLDLEDSNTVCLAIGWGHSSRVWTVRFLGTSPPTRQDINAIQLISTGEDATSRLWNITSQNTGNRDGSGQAYSFTMRQVGTATYHSGKNVWSLAVLNSSDGAKKIVTGAADSKIITYHLSSSHSQDTVPASPAHTTSKAIDLFRSYAFIDERSFIFTTNSGTLFPADTTIVSNDTNPNIQKYERLHQTPDLKGYSISAGSALLKAAFLAGSSGTIYIDSKVAGIFLQPASQDAQKQPMTLLTTSVGSKTAQLISVDLSSSPEPCVLQKLAVPLPQLTPGFIVTSMALVRVFPVNNYLFIGSRTGCIAIYTVPKAQQATADGESLQITLSKVVGGVHGKEAVTSMIWIPSELDFGSQIGYLLSVGRDGSCAVLFLDLTHHNSELVHRTALPFGPNIEGVCINQGNLMIYGFRGTKFVLYSEATEEEVMAIECGGAHRTWDFSPGNSHPGGTFVWTQASNMHVFTFTEASHVVLRNGGHGREIKAAAVSPPIPAHGRNVQLVATGAEDTDIKIFEYTSGDSASAPNIHCLRTLRKHTTGIQHLQWSEDGEYLFSSGGCEEFYMWRIRMLPVIGVGAVCETVCAPESEIADLRIVSFAARRQEGTAVNAKPGFVISMVYSDSTVRIYTYNGGLISNKWRLLATGTYLTSCLTQCVFLDPMISYPAQTHDFLTSGTDGHIAFWSLPKQESTADPVQVHHTSRTKLHQSTVKTLTYQHISPDTALLITGGDDGAVGLTLIRKNDKATPMLSRLLIPRAHASAVTASAIISLLDPARFQMATSGNDQRVILWEITIEEDAVRVEKLGGVSTAVADVSSMVVLDGGARVLVCGVGMQVWRIS
ncbi:WD40 repeat-like protein [Lepidopterella palustris CBS 459.81]|uniref:WD40 repeat-like protein n=1 Tax=Lepidopterella palustris CBS 459.81 TaxID=1314670 RepID=A0A8E2E9F3_9PEZI|nr:WD40 repeat-like protein [Lepidopterella palustris CBS 459.81]